MRPWRKFKREVYGTASTGYLLIGEAPGYLSWKKGRRFTGPAGMLIRRALRRVGHPQYQDLEDLFYMTDVVKCHPAPRGNPASNRSPSRAEVQACSGHLARELQVLNPSVVVTFGKAAAEAVKLAAPAITCIAFPHPSPRNQRTILKQYPSMQAFEDAIMDTCRELIARLPSTLRQAHGPEPSRGTSSGQGEA
jgi:uracil-DNA glycosylase family 4